MYIQVTEQPVHYKMQEDNVFLCSHQEAFLMSQDSFNPDDGLQLTVVCPLADCTGVTNDEATEIYERLA